MAQKQKICDPAMLIADSQTFNDNFADSLGPYTKNKITLDGNVSLQIELIAVSQKTFCFWIIQPEVILPLGNASSNFPIK